MFAAVFGYIPLLSSLFRLGPDNIAGFLYPLGFSALGLLLLAILAGFAHDREQVFRTVHRVIY